MLIFLLMLEVSDLFRIKGTDKASAGYPRDFDIDSMYQEVNRTVPYALLEAARTDDEATPSFRVVRD